MLRATHALVAMLTMGALACSFDHSGTIPGPPDDDASAASGAGGAGGSGGAGGADAIDGDTDLGFVDGGGAGGGEAEGRSADVTTPDGAPNEAGSPSDGP